jgi:imidazolonepropionase
MHKPLLIHSIRQLATPKGHAALRGEAMNALVTIENAAVMVEQGIITAVGDSATMLAKLRTAQAFATEHPSANNVAVVDVEELDASGCVATPGFVDSHTHLVFAGSREHEFAMRAEGKTYQEIANAGGGIISTMQATRAASHEELTALALARLDALIGLGTTTVEIKSGYGLDVASEHKLLHVIQELRTRHPLTIVPTFLGAHAFAPEFRHTPEDRERYVALIINEMLPYIRNNALAEFCDVFCEQGYFTLDQSERILRAAQGLGFGLKLHADQLSAFGALELGVRLGAVSLDHLECTTTTGIEALKTSATIATALPGASLFLNHPYPPARAMIDAGCAVALATDFNPGSSMMYSMPLMMSLACTQMRMTTAEALTAATLNGAAALGLAHERGSIERGKRADIVLFRVPDYRYISYHVAENHVAHVIKDGKRWSNGA